MSAVPRQPPRRAVALSYDPAIRPAPIVTATGSGHLAEEIVRRARAAGVPVTRDEPLVELLSTLDLGAVIPPDLYLVVAEVLAYVYRLEAQANRQPIPSPARRGLG